LGDLIGALERAIETAVKSISFVDGGARRELSRTQLSLGVSNIYLKGLIAASDAYLAELKAKPAGKGATKGKTSARKTSAKGKSAPKSKAATKAKAGGKTAGGKPKAATKKAPKSAKS
jgi:hypothetical protein